MKMDFSPAWARRPAKYHPRRPNYQNEIVAEFDNNWMKGDKMPQLE